MASSPLPDRIRSARIQAGKSQSALARELELDQSSISDWERGISTPTWANMTRLAKALQISLDELASEAA